MAHVGLPLLSQPSAVLPSPLVRPALHRHWSLTPSRARLAPRRQPPALHASSFRVHI
ncbi:hypothetical protein WOLCODRAFT_28013 [Wolfiporia cocos MD-104 SS10]|uniref:Uncharacterized protein n=1 Tax=Wolfiporia cocos (strain MD-104) TaxID=742152 RepID=A0A2H3J052_WOLCO|nr:hypothetical protein WOLCODRAFT_28013 [Wolfiporia cocos MD-104 SS10]